MTEVTRPTSLFQERKRASLYKDSLLDSIIKVRMGPLIIFTAQRSVYWWRMRVLVPSKLYTSRLKLSGFPDARIVLLLLEGGLLWSESGAMGPVSSV